MIKKRGELVKFDDDEIWSETNERTAIQYKGITVTYQINPEKSAWIYANISDYEKSDMSLEDIEESILKIKNSIEAVSSSKISESTRSVNESESKTDSNEKVSKESSVNWKRFV